MSWYLWISFTVGLTVVIMFIRELHDWMIRGDDAKEALYREHREKLGEGDECPWSVRLTAADKREAMHLARVELGLEEDRPPQVEREQTEWVRMIHPTSLGEEPAVVTREAWEQVWKQKGWIMYDGNVYRALRGPYVSPPSKPVPGMNRIANFKLPEVTELDPAGMPTNLDEVLNDENKPNTTWLGQF